MMGHVLDPERYMENLWDMGMTVSLQRMPDTWWMKEHRTDEVSLIGKVA